MDIDKIIREFEAKQQAERAEFYAPLAGAVHDAASALTLCRQLEFGRQQSDRFYTDLSKGLEHVHLSNQDDSQTAVDFQNKEDDSPSYGLRGELKARRIIAFVTVDGRLVNRAFFIFVCH
jgi:hypothetical protein